ncbi:MAG: putative bifunctional diguanylate cyclase/phosphodiesterase [Desulfopila sp.]
MTEFVQYCSRLLQTTHPAWQHEASMAGDADSIDTQIETDRLAHLYGRSKIAFLTLGITSMVFTLMLKHLYAWPPILLWNSILFLALGLRLATRKLYFSPFRQVLSLAVWLWIFRFEVLLAGLIIGGINIFFFTTEPITFLFVSIILPYGITVGAVTMLLDLVSFAFYEVTLLAPIVYQLSRADDPFFFGTAMLTVILGVFLFRFSREYNRNFIVHTRLRYENKKLLEDLEEERNKLSNRLGHIFNDSTTEIYVVDADSLMCLQVNQGAVDTLGYSRDELKDVSILDIFTDIDRNALSELLAPLYRGGTEPVKYKGFNRRKDGTIFPVEASLQLSIADVPPIIVVNVQNVTERTNWEERLIYQANYDQLTGVYNRHYIQSLMHSVLTRAKRRRRKVALLFLDLDNFKDINDSLGHECGDEVLRLTVERISSFLRECDIIARVGGDEFTILLEDLTENDHVEVVAVKIIETFKQPFVVKNREVYTTASIGISIFPDDGDSHDQLMQCADMAMYHAKQDGRNTYHFFSQEMRRISEERMLISNYLRDALGREEFFLVYQPKVDTRRSRIVGAEALLRWRNHDLGEISPYVFIPLAENLGLIHDLGRWVLQEACREASGWRSQHSGPIGISVNVSPQQFRAGSLPADVENALVASGLPPQLLELEITENLLMQDSETPLLLLKDLSQRGIRIALDDFGTGYSSLSYVRRFPLQVLKIDRSFICDLETDKSNRALVDAIIAMARSLELEIVAEGVENTIQVDYLRQRGVDIIQGYVYSPPVPAEHFRQLIKDKKSV